MNEHQTISQWAEAVGKRRIAEAVGVVGGAVRNALARGAFPARWYVGMREAGLEPPERFFNFHRAPQIGPADDRRDRPASSL
jgi:hypothetical protein